MFLPTFDFPLCYIFENRLSLIQLCSRCLQNTPIGQTAEPHLKSYGLSDWTCKIAFTRNKIIYRLHVFVAIDEPSSRTQRLNEKFSNFASYGLNSKRRSPC